MPMSIAERLEEILALTKNAKGKAWDKAEDHVKEIAKLGKKKPHRDEAVAALKLVVEKTNLDWVAATPLAELATEEDVEFLRSRIDERVGEQLYRGLLRLLGRDAYEDGVNVVLNSKLDGSTREQVLQALCEHSGHKFDELVGGAMIPKDEDLPLDELREWREAGFPDYVPPKIEVPEKELKKARITLPDDYVEFLRKHDGRDRVEYDDEEWSLHPGTKLFEPTNVDGTDYPTINVLVGYVKSMEDAFPDGETTDAKEKPYALDRLAAGLAIGESVDGDVLYLDPSDGHSVWIYRHDGGDVEKGGKTFKAWKRKTRKAW